MIRAAPKLLVFGFILLCLSGRSAPASQAGQLAPSVPAPASQSGKSVASVPTPAGADDSDVLDNLDECSPFSSMDGTQELDFDTMTGVVSKDDKAIARTVPADTRPAASKTVGRFAANEGTGEVVVRIGGTTRRYTLVAPKDSDQCILADGKAGSVDLRRSWFGEAEDDPDLPASVGPKPTALRS